MRTPPLLAPVLVLGILMGIAGIYLFNLADQAAYNSREATALATPPFPTSWHHYDSRTLRFSAEFPVTPRLEELSAPTPVGRMPMTTLKSEVNGVTFMISVGTYPRKPILAAAGVVKRSQRGVASLFHRPRVTSWDRVRGSFPERAMTLQTDEPFERLDARFIYAHPRLYQLVVRYRLPPKLVPTERFFAGFRLHQKAATQPE